MPTDTRHDLDRGAGDGMPSQGRGLRPLHAMLLFLVTSVAFVLPSLWLGSSMGAVENVLLFPPYAETSAVEPEVGIGLQGDHAIQLGLPAEFYRSLRSGDLQLWEPDIAGGTAMFTGVYNRLLSVFNWPFLVLPPTVATTASVFLSVLAAQLGAYALSRRFGMGVAGAAVAGVAYGFGGPLTAAVLRYHEMFLLPAWLFAVHGTVTGGARRWGFAALCGALTALVWLSGFPAAAVFATYTAAALTLHLLVVGARRAAGWSARARWAAAAATRTALAVAAGLAVAALQLLPTLEFLDATFSRGRRYVGGQLPSAALGGMFSGRLFGAEQDGDWWFQELVNVVESSSTLGMVGLGVLATLLLGVRSTASRRAERHLSLFALPLALVLLQATYFGGPLLLALQKLPLLDETLFTRVRFVAFLMLALCIGHGVDRLLARARDGERPGWLLRAELAVGAAMLALGLRHAAAAVNAYHVRRAVALDLVVPVLALVAAVTAVVLLARRPAPLTAVLALLLAAELQWGAFGLTPFTEAGEFYPNHSAVEVLREDVSAGGQLRFFDRANLALYAGSSAYLGLRDALANWPTFAPYQQLIELADPQVTSSAGKAVFEPSFSAELDLGSPALDAASAGWYVAPLAEPPVQTEPGPVLAAGLEGEGSVSAVVERPATRVRAVVVDGLARPAGCERGFADVEVAGHRSRRPVRHLATTGAPVVFPLPDVAVGNGSRLRVSSTACRVSLADATVTALRAAPDSDVVLRSVDGWQAYRRPSALPRLQMARRAVVVTDPERRLARLARSRSRETVLLSRGGPVGPFGPGEAEFQHDGEDRVEVAVRSQGPGLLVLRDVAAPGWRATVDGAPAEIIEADHAFRAVAVPAGRSRVVFTYLPAGLRTGAAACAAGALLLLVMLALHLLRLPSRRER